ncbi:MAG: PIN domain-containing protein, partial [Thermomicrobiales bacterium]
AARDRDRAVSRAMLDTNVLASGIVGLAAGASPPAEVIRRWGRREFALVLSDHVLDELDRAHTRPSERKDASR